MIRWVKTALVVAGAKRDDVADVELARGDRAR